MKNCKGMLRHGNRLFHLYLVLNVVGVLGACGGGDAPLDAETRATIDSTAAAQIGLARLLLDSLCAHTEQTQMAHLVDSMKQVRTREIAEQLRSIQK